MMILYQLSCTQRNKIRDKVNETISALVLRQYFLIMAAIHSLLLAVESLIAILLFHNTDVWLCSIKITYWWH